jgi:hypothetical protein
MTTEGPGIHSPWEAKKVSISKNITDTLLFIGVFAVVAASATVIFIRLRT